MDTCTALSGARRVRSRAVVRVPESVAGHSGEWLTRAAYGVTYQRDKRSFALENGALQSLLSHKLTVSCLELIGRGLNPFPTPGHGVPRRPLAVGAVGGPRGRVGDVQTTALGRHVE